MAFKKTCLTVAPTSLRKSRHDEDERAATQFFGGILAFSLPYVFTLGEKQESGGCKGNEEMAPSITLSSAFHIWPTLPRDNVQLHSLFSCKHACHVSTAKLPSSFLRRLQNCSLTAKSFLGSNPWAATQGISVGRLSILPVVFSKLPTLISHNHFIAQCVLTTELSMFKSCETTDP